MIKMRGVWLLAVFGVVVGGEQCGEDVGWLCRQETLCDKCIQVHECCSFCYDQSFQKSKCDLKENLINNNCSINALEISEISSAEPTKDDDFTNYIESGTIQIRPQRFKVKLRKDQPAKITFTYVPARNYPLDLYYLMDVSYTMAFDLDTLINVAEEMAQNMQKVTKNFRLALGIYTDKADVPFAYTTNREINERCQSKDNAISCNPSFDFKHKMNFTSNITEFIEQVKVLKNQTTINIDEPEGGLDALMQTILCQKEMGWNGDSRKVVLIATDAELHLAGEGKLIGAVKRNTGQCFLDSEGNYFSSLEYDYPSLEEINRMLIEMKINAVFAAKQNVYIYYEQLNKVIPTMTSSALLQEHSENVLKVVSESAQNVIRVVRFSADTLLSPELKITFKSDCGRLTEMRTTSFCDNVEEGKRYTFEVTFELTKLMENEKVLTKIITIEEQNIQDKIYVELEYVGQRCSCDGEKQAIGVSESCSNHGDYRCGACYCYEGWSGSKCEDACENVDNQELCKEATESYTSPVCYFNGYCECGKCVCDPGYVGKYCKHSCPLKNGKHCDGHGECLEGKCVCHSGYDGTNCECATSTETCIAPGMLNPCSGNGNCNCGKCDCNDGYRGNYCQICETCSGLCLTYERCVVAALRNVTLDANATECSKTEVFKGTMQGTEDECFTRYTLGEESCQAYYTYKAENGVMKIAVYEDNCRKTLPASVTTGVIIGVILAVGLLAIFIYKVRIVMKDREEYRKFLIEKENFSQMQNENPLYNSPVRTYKMPQEYDMEVRHSKRE